MPPTRSQTSDKRKTPPTHALAPHPASRTQASGDDSSSGEEEQQTATSRATARSGTSHSSLRNQIMNAVRKQPPPAAATRPSLSLNITTAATTTPRASPPSQPVRASPPAQEKRNHDISQSFSPTVAVAVMPQNSPQAVLLTPMNQGGRNRESFPAHSVGSVEAQGDPLDDASSLSGTETENAKAMRMLHQYFLSLAASGTVRSIVEEKDLITNKLGIIFRKVKFINADTDLSYEGNIAKVLYKEMRIPETYKIIWWEQMKIHVRKKMDEGDPIVELL
jgi:hypothetical protein